MSKGKKLTTEHKKKLSEIAKEKGFGKWMKGRTPWNKGKKGVQKGHWKGKKMPLDLRLKLSEAQKGKKKAPFSEEHRRNIGLSKKGSKSPFWRGGVAIENKRIRASIDFRLWREAVFARDNWTCQECEIRGGELHPHHIKAFSLFPELRFAIDNGVTLCASCHRKTNNYGKIEIGFTQDELSTNPAE